MARTKEYPTSPLPSLMREGGTDGLVASILEGSDRTTPATAAQALMQAAPFEEPPLSKEEWREILHAVQDALVVLDERESWIVHARIWRGMSVRQVAKELALSKTHLDRVYKQALKRLRAELEQSGVAADVMQLLGRPVSDRDTETVEA